MSEMETQTGCGGNNFNVNTKAENGCAGLRGKPGHYNKTPQSEKEKRSLLGKAGLWHIGTHSGYGCMRKECNIKPPESQKGAGP